MNRHHLSDTRGYSLIEILVVVGLIGVVGAIAVPMMSNSMGFFRLSGDARSISNSVALAKMRAASDFSRVRLYVDLSTNSHHIESWDKVNSTWVVEGGTTYLSSNVQFSWGAVGTPPPNSQGVIGQAPFCTDDLGAVIGNTSCFMFNSRGVPIDSTFSPTAADVLYLTDGSAVYAVTAAATGMIRLWRTLPTATPTWVLN
jgi:prepilin-type N-terminal cleavage/methylation domain-containing protein